MVLSPLLKRRPLSLSLSRFFFSQADHQNYGDDANAQTLLYPSTLCSMGVEETEFTKHRSKAEIVDLFSAIGQDLSGPRFERLYEQAADPS